MIKIKDVLIDGLHCYEVTVTKYYHGPTHRPTVKARMGLLVDGRPVSNMEVDDLPEEVHESAEALLSAVEQIMLPTVASEAPKSTTEPQPTPKGIIEEF